MGEKLCVFQVMQDGMVVAEASGTDEDSVRREIWHYAMVYAQDGAVTIRSKSGHDIRPSPDPQES